MKRARVFDNDYWDIEQMVEMSMRHQDRISPAAA
jgi:hypothetical protein